MNVMYQDPHSVFSRQKSEKDKKLNEDIKAKKAELMQLTNQKLGRLSDTVGMTTAHTNIYSHKTRKHNPLRLYARNWKEAWLEAVGKAKWDVSALEILYVDEPVKPVEGAEKKTTERIPPYVQKVKHLFKGVLGYCRWDVRIAGNMVANEDDEEGRAKERPDINEYLAERDDRHFTNKIVYRGLAMPNCLNLNAETELDYAALTHLTDQERFDMLAQAAENEEFSADARATKYSDGQTGTWPSQLFVQNAIKEDFCSIPFSGFDSVGVKVNDRGLRSADLAGDVAVHVDAGTFRIVKIRESKQDPFSDDEAKKKNDYEEQLKLHRFVWEHEFRTVCTDIDDASWYFSQLDEQEKKSAKARYDK